MGNTKKIRMLTSVAGTEYAYSAQEEVDAPEYIADDLIRGGHAVLVAGKAADKAEKATSKAAAAAEKR